MAAVQRRRCPAHRAPRQPEAVLVRRLRRQTKRRPLRLRSPLEKARSRKMARPPASRLSPHGFRAGPRPLGTRYQQAMTPVVEAILPEPPFDKTRSGNLIASVQNIPAIITDAKTNLQHPAAPFAKLAVESLADIRSQLWQMAHDVAPQLTGDNIPELAPAVEQAASALESFREWLQQRLPTMPPHTPVGRDNYIFFLKNV